MGRRSASLLKGRASAQERFDALIVNAQAAPRQDDSPFTWTILLTSTGLLRWRSLRTVTADESTMRDAMLTTTGQILATSTRLGATPVLYNNGKLRDEAPAPLTPDEIEMQNDLAFDLDHCRGERDYETHYARCWVPRLRRLGLIGPPRIPGLPTEEGTPCTCPMCRPTTPPSTNT